MQTGTDAQATFKPVTEEWIQTQTDSGSFSRGKSYYRNGHIFDTVLRGALLQGRCEGSEVEPYLVTATLIPSETKGKNVLAAYECDCLRGGFCKHVVALLLTWAHAPEQFEVRLEFAALLKEKSREELVALVLRMLGREPELESLLEIPQAVAQAEPGLGGRRTLDPAVIRRQVKSAFRSGGHEWGAAQRVAADLSALLQRGDDYAQAGQWANAQVVYGTVGEEVAEGYEEMGDEEGDLAVVINDCAEGLGKCLDAQQTLPESERLDPGMRADLIRTLYDLWKVDLEMGGIDIAPDVPEVLARNVTDIERAELENRLRKEMGPGAGFSDKWRNEAMVGFLLTLKEHSGISDEEMLQEYRNAGLYDQVAGLLLERGRVDEAMEVAQEHLKESYATLEYARKLLGTGKEEIPKALQLVEARLKEAEKAKHENDVRSYLHWLGEQYVRLGMANEALAIELRRFQANPGKQTYETAKQAAQLPGQPREIWDELRPNLISTLESKEGWGALVEIYLDEKDARSALDALTEMKTRKSPMFFGGWYGVDLTPRVAEAAEQEYPDEARALYIQLAEDLIAQRGRESYQRAAGYLVRVHHLYQTQGQAAEWHAYIGRLREQNKSLRALKEELDARSLS